MFISLSIFSVSLLIFLSLSIQLLFISATSNLALHTPAYIQLETAKSMSENLKIYWGEKLPSFYAGSDDIQKLTSRSM